MKKKEENVEQIPMFISDPCTNEIHWGVHYIRDKKGNWSHECLAVNCERTMKNLVKKWKNELDSHGIYMGIMESNKFPEVTPYEELKTK